MSSHPIKTAITASDTGHIAIIELLFYAYRDFTADPDRVLAPLGFGRAHHRVVYFVSRQPGLSVTKLLDVLGITKQSLARVLKQLIDTGYIVQQPGKKDRRQRKLYPTQKGHDLALELTRPQSRRITRALENAGLENPDDIIRFLAAMLDRENQKEQVLKKTAS